MAIHMDLGCCTVFDLESMGHSRYHGMANTDHWSLSLWVCISYLLGCVLLIMIYDRLHATPMFLIASYSPAFYTINAYFHPSQW
jgi:hypothetical protein